MSGNGWDHHDWDHEIDVLVAGSGAGGMTAALTAADAGLDTLIVEKAARYGGNTALSGGGIWIPNNPTLRGLGRTDDPEDVRRYLRSIVGDRVCEARIDAYVEHGPAALELLHRVSRHLEFSWCPGYSDYHPDRPGGSAAGHTIEPRPFDSRALGADEDLLLPAGLPIPMGLWMTGYDARRLVMFKRTWEGRRMLLVAAWRVLSNLVRRRHMQTLGASLVARLRLTLKDHDVPLWLNAPITELLVEAGEVVGARVERDGRSLRIRARAGVVLATGGFEHDPVLRAEHLPAGGQEDFSAGATTNVGDGQRLGAKVGAGSDLMDDAWWMPSVRLPTGGMFPLVFERCIPRMVIVDQHGARFTNEAAPYVNFVHTQLRGDHRPAYLILDATARRRYQFAGIMPGRRFPPSWYGTGLVTRADSLAELAARLGIPADALAGTVERFNTFAGTGRDLDFGRGDSAYDRYYGDPSLPNPNLDRLGPGPYYGIRMDVGDLGTKGGITCDEDSRALRPDGTPIEGLYATGNASASVMGNDYAGAGATIGPAITFGYLAARHAAARRPATRTGGSGPPAG
jgi:3-oxosteroid 1-dehydrogenase